MLTVRETRMVLDTAKQIRSIIEREFALQRFHIPIQNLQPYQRKTVKLMSTELIRILEKEDSGCSTLRKKKFLSYIHARIVQRLLAETQHSTLLKNMHGN